VEEALIDDPSQREDDKHHNGSPRHGRLGWMRVWRGLKRHGCVFEVDRHESDESRRDPLLCCADEVLQLTLSGRCYGKDEY